MAYYQYTVKYLCSDGDDEALVKGIYRTAINIHNPHDFPQKPICWKVVSPTPDGKPTPPQHWTQTDLPPDGGMEINCRLIRGPAGGGPTGFVVIRSRNELDVVAVYTVERPDQPGIQLKIKDIAPRVIPSPSDREMCRNH
jgi:hypothetical protein